MAGIAPHKYVQIGRKSDLHQIKKQQKLELYPLRMTGSYKCKSTAGMQSKFTNQQQTLKKEWLRCQCNSVVCAFVVRVCSIQAAVVRSMYYSKLFCHLLSCEQQQSIHFDLSRQCTWNTASWWWSWAAYVVLVIQVGGWRGVLEREGQGVYYLWEQNLVT